VCAILNGGSSIQPVQWYALGALFFIISDTLNGYTKFVEGNYRRNPVLATYFTSLVLFTWSAFTDIACERCLRVVFDLENKSKPDPKRQVAGKRARAKK